MEHDLSKLAVFRRRVAGEKRQAELRAGVPLARDEAGAVTAWSPPLVVEFKVPDGLALARAEAAAQEAMAAIRQSPAYLERYGFGPRALSDAEMLALARVISAFESAVVLWTDWNFATPDSKTGEAVKRDLADPKAIAEVVGDPDIRAAWMMHLDSVSPLERAEGNVFGASPSTNTGEAPDTAPTAESTETPAPEA